MAGGLDDFDMFEADAAHLSCKEIGCAFDIALVLRKRADTRDTKEIFELCKKPRLVLPGIFKSRGGHLDNLFSLQIVPVKRFSIAAEKHDILDGAPRRSVHRRFSSSFAFSSSGNSFSSSWNALG